ncbi:hypothetical protein TNCV_4527031 [Trichonephila clavipes]|nr:hypothetical protein TNCV_4527031 [Trichonephila clavipes]
MCFEYGRLMKLRDRDRQVLFKEIRKTHPKLMAHILQEFQQASRDCFDKCHPQGSIFASFPWLYCRPRAFDYKVQPPCSFKMVQGTSKLDLRLVETGLWSDESSSICTIWMTVSGLCVCLENTFCQNALYL